MLSGVTSNAKDFQWTSTCFPKVATITTTAITSRSPAHRTAAPPRSPHPAPPPHRSAPAGTMMPRSRPPDRARSRRGAIPTAERWRFGRRRRLRSTDKAVEVDLGRVVAMKSRGSRQVEASPRVARDSTMARNSVVIRGITYLRVWAGPLAMAFEGTSCLMDGA